MFLVYQKKKKKSKFLKASPMVYNDYQLCPKANMSKDT